MSTLLDETAGDLPVKEISMSLSRLTLGSELSAYQNARGHQDISRLSREELEDRFLRLHEETLQLKQINHKQDDKIKKLGTKLMRLVKDRRRMEQLATGATPVSKLRDVEMEELTEKLQEKVRALQAENKGMKQRLLVAKQQLMKTPRPSAYNHVQSRVNSGLKKLRGDALSPSLARPRSTRSLEGGGRPPSGPLPRYGHSLLEESRAEIRNLENVVELQRSHMEELEGVSELLREELRRKEAEYEERLLQVRQEQTSKLGMHISSNMTLIKLQKQLADQSNTVAELEGRFLQLNENKQTLTVSHGLAMAKVDELSAKLKDERLKSLELKKQLQSAGISRMRMEQLQERISELEQERDLLKDSNKKLLNRAFDVSQLEKWQLEEQQLKLQIAQMETALKADLIDKNEILDKVKAERETNEKLKNENRKLEVQFLEQKQQMEELNGRLKFYSRSDYNVAELTEALLLNKMHKSKKSGDLGFLKEVEEETSGGSLENAMKELQAAHAETIQELEKTRNLLIMESRISKDYKAELDATLQKMNGDKVEYEQKLERQAQLLNTRATRIRKLEAQLRDIAYGTKTYVFKPDATAKDEADDETLHLENGENLVELQIVGVTLSASALQALDETEPSTFCTYTFYLFELHSTPVVTGHSPKYGFTSKYVVSLDDRFLDYIRRGSVTVELHQALGLEWRTLAAGELRLQQLLEQEGKIYGSVPLVGSCDEARSFGSVEFRLRLRIPITETLRLKALSPPISSWNELSIIVDRCSDLQLRGSQPPSPYVVYKFFNFPDHPTATVYDCRDPDFKDFKSYSVSMDADLDQYLKSALLQFYVFDYKEEQKYTYLGKARVPLRTLTHDKSLTGVFLLADPSGLPAGHIKVTLNWKFPYILPLGSIKEPRFAPEEQRVEVATEVKQQQDGEKDAETLKDEEDLGHPAASKAPLPKPIQQTQVKRTPTAKKVMFVETTAADQQDRSSADRSSGDRSSADRSSGDRSSGDRSSGDRSSADRSSADRSSADRSSGDRSSADRSSGDRSSGDRSSADRSSGDRSSAARSMSAETTETLPAAPVQVLSKVPQTEEEDDEGQLVSASMTSYSDDSEISEEIVEDVEEVPAAAERESTQSDSDDCIVPDLSTARKLSERVWVEIVSLSLRAESQVARDTSVVRLFVEYSLLGLPTEETPLSLPKPPPGRSINYNYSKVIPVDAENNAARRRLLRGVLQGRIPHMERIRFTVVSEPPEEEEQERECEDVGVAFLRIPEILEKQRDMTEERLNVWGMEDSSEVVGTLTVSVEALQALRSIMEEEEPDIGEP